MFRDRHKNILKEAVGLLQCLRSDKGAGEAKISHLPSAEISKEGILWEKEKAGPKHINVLQNHCSNWESPGPGAVSGCCHSSSPSRVLALAVSTGSEVCGRESKSHTCTPQILGLISTSLGELMGSRVTKLLWKERGERDCKQKEQMKFAFYICFLLRELLLWVKSAETSQVIAAWIFKPGYKYLIFFF